MHALSFDDFATYAKTHQRVAVYREILADKLTPISIAEALGDKLNDGAMLESGLQHHDAGRYSFIAVGTMAALEVKANEIHVQMGKQHSIKQGSPFPILRELIKTLDCHATYPHMDFVNGAVGFLSYDAVRLFESIPDRHVTQDELPIMQFHFYETTFMFDHVKQTLLISHIITIEDDLKTCYDKAQTAIDGFIQCIIQPEINLSSTKPIANLDATVEVSESDEAFMDMVNSAKDYITKGDAFQIVLSRTFLRPYRAKPLDIYRYLRRVSPAPYMFYIPTKAGIIVGASPEKLVSVHHGEVNVNPIAGTRRRHAQDDASIEASLKNDPKECAEHMMLVDLARNDVGAVCKPGTVKVLELMQVKHFSHVSHMTSVVKGQLRDDKDALDALAAAFPAGTLSGAPKIRAMGIIDELEGSKRGLYGGAICRLDYQGNLDSCIAIRMALLQQGVAKVRTGAGIVFDSDPLSEALETKHKAEAMLTTLRLAEEALA